jgi:hypothetical protein
MLEKIPLLGQTQISIIDFCFVIGDLQRKMVHFITLNRAK